MEEHSHIKPCHRLRTGGWYPLSSDTTSHGPRRDAAGCIATTWGLICATRRLFLEGLPCDSCAFRPWSATFAEIKIGSILHSCPGDMELHSHVVCTLERFTLITVDAVSSDSEISFFWQAESRSRWSAVRILFMLVSSYICCANRTRLIFSRTVTSRSFHILCTCTGA